MHVTVLRHGNWSSVPWADVKVGDFVKVTSSQFFPADLVLLSSRSEVPAYLIDILLWSVFLLFVQRFFFVWILSDKI